MMKYRLLLLMVCYASIVFGQDLSKYERQTAKIYGYDFHYRILYPENFDQNKKYPVVFFLHGSGERGNDNEKQLTHGAKLFLSAEFRSKHPAIVIFPQCEENDFWSNVNIETIGETRFFGFRNGGDPKMSMNLLMGFTEDLLKKKYVDKKRVYIGGLSMGGMGTFEILRRMPKTFAAAFAICGGDNPANVQKYKHVPLWIFHGGKDDVVQPQLSYNVYDALRSLGVTPKFTIYPKANHNSWDPAFAEPGLMEWLFTHHR